jgi:hypothetical protein
MMGSQAATVDSLIKKGKFEPQVAMAIAEAIDNAMSDSQLVTVPILDARFAHHRAEIRGDLMRLENKIDSVRTGLENKIDSVRTDLERKIDVAFATLDSKIDRSVAVLDSKIDRTVEVLAGKIDVAAANTKAELVRWVFIAMGCNLAFSVGVVAIVNALQHH